MDDEQFLAFGKRWCCKLCQTYLTSDKLPPLALNNLLASPWLATPAVLQQLTPLEGDLVTGFTLDRVAHLQHGLTGRVPPVKTVHIVSSQAKGREISQVLGSFAVPLGFKFDVRLEETKSAHHYLLDVSKRHNTLLADGLTPEFVSRTFDLETLEFEQKLATELQGGHFSQASPPPQPGTDDPTIDWFVKSGPCLTKTNTIIVPHLDPLLPEELFTMLAKGSNALYDGMASNLDPHMCAPPETIRSPQVPLQDWCTSRFGNVDRSGPANDPSLLLAFSAVSRD